MTTAQRAARRKVIVKREAARKIRETWKRKRLAGTATRGRRSRGMPTDDVDPVDMPAEDILDELPASLVG